MSKNKRVPILLLFAKAASSITLFMSSAEDTSQEYQAIFCD
jgi:hypothetical protein